MRVRRFSFTRRIPVAGLAEWVMANPQPKEETRAAFDFVHEEIGTLLIELSDLMESGAIPRQEGVDALRMAAGFVSLVKRLAT
jgi:hypothetical protein